MKIKYPIKSTSKTPAAPITKFKRVAGKSTPPKVTATLEAAETGITKEQVERLCAALENIGTYKPGKDSAFDRLAEAMAEAIRGEYNEDENNLHNTLIRQGTAITHELRGLRKAVEGLVKAVSNFVPMPDEPTPAAVSEEPSAEGTPVCDPGKEGDTAD